MDGAALLQVLNLFDITAIDLCLLQLEQRHRLINLINFSIVIILAQSCRFRIRYCRYGSCVLG